MWPRFVALALLVAAPAGCASSEAPKAEAPPAQVESKRSDEPHSSVEAQLGGLNQQAVEAKFLALQKSVDHCLNQGADRVPDLGGSFALSIRVRKDGQLRWAYMSESTLGDRDTETCILAAALSRPWPKPVGGEGEASHKFSVETAASPHSWKESRLKGALATIRKKMWKCIGRVRGRFTATVYVRSDGGVETAGVAPPNAAAEQQSDCVVGVLRTFNFGRQRRRLSKVTFRI